MYIDDKQLKEFILDSGLVSRKDFDKAHSESIDLGKKVGEVLVDTGKITEDGLRRIQAYILGIPFVSLKGQKLDADTLSLIPEPIARKNNIVAFKKTESNLEVAMLDIDDLEAIDFIKKKVNLKIVPRLTDSESIKSVLLQYQKTLKAEFGDIIQKEAKEIELSGLSQERDLKKMAEDLPIIRIVDTLLKHSALQNASDIHIEPLETEVLIRYRIDGLLHDAMTLPKTIESGIVARIKVLSNLKLDEKRLPQDGRFKTEVNDEKISFRVSLLPTYYGEKIVMRLLREGASSKHSLEGLGFHGFGLELIHQATKKNTGMILTTGPTGSGKTTTLYTILDILNTPDVNISTVEDPIEYQMKRVNQTQVRPELGFTFSSGLRTLVRQDPDVIMIGEIRDNETASLAVNASLTGHLVLSTLHTNSAAGTIPRLLDMKVEPFLLVSTIDIVIAQRLIRRLKETKEKYFLNKSEIESLGKLVDLDKMMKALKEENILEKSVSWDEVPFYRAAKEEESLDDGYSGRLVVCEILKMNNTIKNLVLKNASSAEIEAQARKEGMMSMVEDGVFKAVQGLTSLEEVLRVVNE